MPDGGTKPVIKYGSKGFLSPSRMLKYKSKQIYEDSVGSWEAYTRAIRLGTEYHQLFDALTTYTPKLLPQDQREFAEAIHLFYKKYQIQPLVNEFILWDETSLLMCIADGIGVDKEGNLVVLELKTFSHMDAKKELLSHFQTFIAKTILENKLNIKGVKCLTLHWSSKAKVLKVKDHNLDLTSLANHFQAIIATEYAWDMAVENLKKSHKKPQQEKNDFLAQLRKQKK